MVLLTHCTFPFKNKNIPGQKYPGRLSKITVPPDFEPIAPLCEQAFAARITARIRQSLLVFFRFALESPFPLQFPAAIAPPAAL